MQMPGSHLARTRTAEIWSDVLGSPPAADDANFFDEGGNSLQAFDLLERIEDQLAVEIQFKQFWAHATFGELCAIVTRLLTAGPAHR